MFFELLFSAGSCVYLVWACLVFPSFAFLNIDENKVKVEVRWTVEADSVQKVV